MDLYEEVRCINPSLAAIVCPPYEEIQQVDHRYLQVIEDMIKQWGRTYPRVMVEGRGSVKQLVAYTIIEDKSGKYVFCYERAPRIDGEKRLHNKMTLGIGGHLRPRESILQGAMRELQEETQDGEFSPLRLVAVINTDHDQVGRDHIGLVFKTESLNNELKIRGGYEFGRGWGFFKLSVVLKTPDWKFEYWSKLIAYKTNLVDRSLA